MEEFLEKTLRQTVHIEKNTELYERLPLVYRGRYNIYNVKTNGFLWIAIKPENEVGLVMLRKDRAKVEKEAKLNCALFFDRTTFYIKEKLLEEGIPFVIMDKQIYLPFIGYLLSGTKTAVYEKWQEIKVSEASEKLGVTKMSVSRCFDEIEYLDIDILRMKGKSRVIYIPEDIRELWNQIQGKLRSPVVNRYILREDVKLDKKAGISALCEYSLLTDNDYPTYAVIKKEIRNSGIQEKRQAGKGDDIGCVVLE